MSMFFWPLQILFNGDGKPGFYWFSEPICKIYNKLPTGQGQNNTHDLPPADFSSEAGLLSRRESLGRLAT